MNSDLSINEIFERCRHYWWLAIVLAVSSLLIGFLVARMPRYQSVITVWSIPVVVRDQPVSRVDVGFSEALYASMLVGLQEEWRSNMEDAGIDVTVRLNRQTYHLMAEGIPFGFNEEATRTFDNFSAWIAGKPMVEGSGEVEPANSLSELVWVGELSGPEVNQKYPHIQVTAPLASLMIGFLTFFAVILVDVSVKKSVKSQ